MALKGEGDPRWVVRERQDGRNVNGWHWADKDVSSWAHSRLKELINSDIVAAPVAGEHFGAKVDNVDSVDGDATLYNRKGTLKVLYDLKVSGKWTSCHDDEKDRTHGTFKFELFDEDPEFVVAVDAKSKGEALYKTIFSRALTPIIRTQCRTFIAELHAGAGASLDGIQVPPATKPKKTETSVTDYLRSGMNQASSNESKPTSDTCQLTLTDQFVCSTMDLFKALTDRARLEAVTRAKAISEAVPNGQYDLMSGTVRGQYKHVTPGERIEMTWKLKNWDADSSPSHVIISFAEDEGKCKLTVLQHGVPKKYRTETEGFWRIQIFQSIKVVLGYGRATSFF